jgi:hypothetical protein
MEGIFFIFVFIGVIAITALLFGIWVFVSIIRLIARMIGGVLAPPRPPAMPVVRASASIRCENDHCHAANPSNARFCRRCGHALQPQRVATRRVALW